MIALSPATSPTIQLLLRSLLPRNQRLRIPDSQQRRRWRRELTILELVSHLVMTSFLFLALITLVWVVSWTFHLLHAVYPFSEELFRALYRFEIFLVYADVVTTGILLLNGIWHYILEAIRGNS
jgi:hypothetical protein